MECYKNQVLYLSKLFNSKNKHTMKKLFFTPLLLLSLTTAIVAQTTEPEIIETVKIPKVVLKNESRFLLNIHGGYTMGLGSTFKFYPDDISSVKIMQVGSASPTKSVSYSTPTEGLGQGYRLGGGLSYIVNDFINVGLDVDYLKSTIYRNRDSSFNQSKILGIPGSMDEYIYSEHKRTSYDATIITFSPNITFKAISKPKWYLYNKLGAMISFGPSSTQTDLLTTNTRSGWQGFYQDVASATAKTYKWGIKNPAYGFMGGFGAQFKLTQKLRVYSELQFSHMVFVIRKKTLTEFKVDGADMLNSLSISQRVIDFSNSFTTDQQSATDPNAPSRAVTERIPITNLGLQAGISYRF